MSSYKKIRFFLKALRIARFIFLLSQTTQKFFLSLIHAFSQKKMRFKLNQYSINLYWHFFRRHQTFFYGFTYQNQQINQI